MLEVAVGSEVAGCRIEELVGRGGMGIVYRGVHMRLNRAVAFKVITPAHALDPEFRERFEREARLTASIEHPNVIPVYDAGELESGELYLVMRWVDGTDLSRLLAFEIRLPPRRAIGLVAPVALALDAAHSRELVHRDVKPANVLITQSEKHAGEHVYLSDFGIARGPEAGRLPDGGFVGTVAYAAPERIDGDHGGAAADIYALGCVLYEALTGWPPFGRASGLDTMRAHLSRPIPPIRTFVPEVPAEVEEVVHTALAKDPAARFGVAGEMAAALNDALVGRPVERTVVTHPRSTAGPVIDVDRMRTWLSKAPSPGAKPRSPKPPADHLPGSLDPELRGGATIGSSRRDRRRPSRRTSVVVGIVVAVAAFVAVAAPTDRGSAVSGGVAPLLMRACRTAESQSAAQPSQVRQLDSTLARATNWRQTQTGVFDYADRQASAATVLDSELRLGARSQPSARSNVAPAVGELTSTIGAYRAYMRRVARAGTPVQLAQDVRAFQTPDQLSLRIVLLRLTGIDCLEQPRTPPTIHLWSPAVTRQIASKSVAPRRQTSPAIVAPPATSTQPSAPPVTSTGSSPATSSGGSSKAAPAVNPSRQHGAPKPISIQSGGAA